MSNYTGSSICNRKYLILEKLYIRVKNWLLNSQTLSLGLLPTDNYQDKYISDINTNLYTALCFWSTFIALKNNSFDEGKLYEMEHATVKLMRGILFCYMQECDRIESFKKSHSKIDAVHLHFDSNTGLSVILGDDFLRIDVVSLFIIVLCMLISSGLTIIYTIDEIDCIQNLVYYIERAYRTPDYGFWGKLEDQMNNNLELHSSSIGMAKAALESISGFNLYGNKSGNYGVVYVDPDSHFRNTFILYSLLPRESKTRNIDSSMIPMLGFPCHAINEPKIKLNILEKIDSNLKNDNGFKRFEYDNEYSVHFTILMCINELFYLNKIKAEGYRKSVKEAFVRDGEEITLKHSKNTIMLKSTYIIMELLSEELISCFELDPLQRYFNLGGHSISSVNSIRHSHIFSDSKEKTIQVCLLSENRNLKNVLLTYGIPTQTIDEIEPIQLCQSHTLVEIYKKIGRNDKLKIYGRPERPIGSLGTSKIYRNMGKTLIFSPLIMTDNSFYIFNDIEMLIDQMKTLIAFLFNNWNMKERPTVIFLLKEYFFKNNHFGEMIKFLSELKNDRVGDIKVKCNRIQTLINTACIDHLDFVIDLPFSRSTIKEIPDRNKLKLSSQHSLHKINETFNIDFSNFETWESNKILERIKEIFFLSHKIIPNQGLKEDYELILNMIYKFSLKKEFWSVTRFCSGLLKKTISSLAPYITTLLVYIKEIIIEGQNLLMKINEPMTPYAITTMINELASSSIDPRLCSFFQELIISMGDIMTQEYSLFTGIVRLRLDEVVKCLIFLLDASSFESVFTHSPSKIKHFLLTIFKTNFVDSSLSQKKVRKINGYLLRFPDKFFSNLQFIVEKSSNGLVINDYDIPKNLPSNVDFMMIIEEKIQKISNPEDRILICELINVLSTVLNRNPEINCSVTIDLNELLENSKIITNNLFESGFINSSELCSLNSFGANGTVSIFGRTIVEKLMFDLHCLDVGNGCTHN